MTFAKLAALLGALSLSFTACQQEVPSPWKEMSFPLRHAEQLPGADATRLVLVYRKTDRRADLFREFKRRLEQKGYEHTGAGKNHDEAARVISSIFEQGERKIRLTITPSGADTNVELKQLD